jgi:hypothetical protein
MTDNSHETSPLLLEADIPSDVIICASSKEQFIQQHTLPFRQQIKWEIQKQAGIAFPTLQSMVITKIPWLISLRFVGGIGAEELAAAALATTLCNVTGYSISVGLSSALSTLSAQAKGELTSRMTTAKRTNNNDPVSSDEEHHPKEDEPILPLVFLYRGMLVQLVFVVPIGIWWICGIKDFLISVGQTETLAAMTEVSILSCLVECGILERHQDGWGRDFPKSFTPCFILL